MAVVTLSHPFVSPFCVCLVPTAFDLNASHLKLRMKGYLGEITSPNVHLEQHQQLAPC
jgi:hypothetical protein